MIAGATSRYFMHGLTIESAFPFLAMRGSTTAAPDLFITASGRAERLGSGRKTHDDGFCTATRSDDERWCIRYRRGEERCSFHASGRTRTIDVRLTPGTRLDPHPIEGPILASWLRMRGVLCLHACAVLVEGRAVLVAGAASAGKSTTSGAFVREGFPLLAEDVVAISRSHRVFPGCGRLRLSVDAARALGWDPGKLPRIAAYDSRVWIDARMDAELPDQSARLSSVFVLVDRDPMAVEPRIRRLSGGDALRSVVDCMYKRPCLGFDPGPMDLLELARGVPIYGVTATGLDRLSALVHGIAATARSEGL